jgi:hypothetical protein
MANRSRYPDAGATTALAIHLAVYVGVAGCFAAGLYWLMQPRVFANAGLAAYKPPPKTVVIYAGSPGAWRPPPAPEPLPEMAANSPPVVAESPAVEPKKEAKQAAVTIQRARRSRPERSNPMQDYAYQPYSFRPWF